MDKQITDLDFQLKEELKLKREEFNIFKKEKIEEINQDLKEELKIIRSNFSSKKRDIRKNHKEDLKSTETEEIVARKIFCKSLIKIKEDKESKGA